MRTFFMGLILVSMWAVGFDQYLYLSKYSPLPNITVIVSIGLALILILINAFRKMNFTFNIPWEILSFFAIIQLSAIGMILSGSSQNSFVQFMKTDLHALFYAVLTIVVMNLINHKNWLNVLNYWRILGVAAAVIGLFQFANAYLGGPSNLTNNIFMAVNHTNPDVFGTEFIRPAAFFSEPAWYSYYLLDVASLILAFGVAQGWRGQIAPVAFCLLAFCSCGSLGGIGSGFFLFFIIWRKLRIPATMKRQLILTCFAITLWAFLFVPSIKEFTVKRLAHLFSDGSSIARWDSIQAAFHLWLDHPIFGVGLGNASLHISNYYRGWWAILVKLNLLPENFKGSTDSAFMVLLCEAGLAGIWAAVSITRNLLKPVSRPETIIMTADDEARRLNIFLWALRTNVTRNIFELIFLSGNLWFPRVWLNVGVFLALKRLYRRRMSAIHNIHETIEAAEGTSLTKSS